MSEQQRNNPIPLAKIRNADYAAGCDRARRLQDAQSTSARDSRSRAINEMRDEITELRKLLRELAALPEIELHRPQTSSDAGDCPKCALVARIAEVLRRS